MNRLVGVLLCLVVGMGDLQAAPTRDFEPYVMRAKIFSVPVGITSVQILAASLARRGLVVVNDGGTQAWLSYALTASKDLHTVNLKPGDKWEMSFPFYTGIISAVRGSGSGNLIITEMLLE